LSLLFAGGYDVNSPVPEADRKGTGLAEAIHVIDVASWNRDLKPRGQDQEARLPAAGFGRALGLSRRCGGMDGRPVARPHLIPGRRSRL